MLYERHRVYAPRDSHSKVGNNEMTVFLFGLVENVFGLEVPVDDAMMVQVLNGLENLAVSPNNSVMAMSQMNVLTMCLPLT